MIKQSWNMSSEEKLRILNLHESATRNLYLIKEQEVSPQDNENIVYSRDSKDPNRYFIFQPEAVGGVIPIDWNRPYYVIGDNPDEGAFIAEVVEKDSENRPTEFRLLKDKPLPYYDLDDPKYNQFKFAARKGKDGNFQHYWNYDQLTANSLIGPPNAGLNYFAVILVKDGRERYAVVPIQVNATHNWMYEYDNEIMYADIKKGQVVELVPRKDVIYDPKTNWSYGFILGTTFPFYDVYRYLPIEEPIPTKEIPGTEIEPPKPTNFGDNFPNNVSYPDKESVFEKPEYSQFQKFIKGNDISKFTFLIQASASKCAAGTMEAKGGTRWENDTTTYPDVKVDPNADKNDVGNLNLTKARAQHFKDFLIENNPELKNAKFEVVAQGSLGTCGTKLEQRKNRKVLLTIQKTTN